MNNTSTVKETTTNDASLPLTKDEIALFKTFMKTPDDVITQFTSAINAFKDVVLKHSIMEDALVNIYNEQRELKLAVAGLVAANNSIADSFIKGQNMFEKQIHDATDNLVLAINKSATVAVDKRNPLFTTTLTSDEQRNWKEKAIGTISGRSFDYGCNKDDDYAAIYGKMKQSGYDVNKLIDEYRKINPGATIIDMCAASEKLRTSFERGLSNLCHKSIVNKIKSATTASTTPHVTYRKANSIPPEIRTLVAKLSHTGTPNGWCYNNAKKILCDNNVNLNELVAGTKKKYNVSDCSIWFAVSKSPEVMKLLNGQINKAAKSAEVK